MLAILKNVRTDFEFFLEVRAAGTGNHFVQLVAFPHPIHICFANARDPSNAIRKNRGSFTRTSHGRLPSILISAKESNSLMRFLAELSDGLVEIFFCAELLKIIVYLNQSKNGGEIKLLF